MLKTVLISGATGDTGRAAVEASLASGSTSGRWSIGRTRGPTASKPPAPRW